MEILFLLLIPALVIPYVLPFVAMSGGRRALALSGRIDALDRQVQSLFAENTALQKQVDSLKRPVLAGAV